MSRRFGRIPLASWPSLIFFISSPMTGKNLTSRHVIASPVLGTPIFCTAAITLLGLLATSAAASIINGTARANVLSMT